MYENIIKRLCDIFISFFAILIFSPVLLTLFCLVKIDSPGPFIFKQERVGLGTGCRDDGEKEVKQTDKGQARLHETTFPE